MCLVGENEAERVGRETNAVAPLALFTSPRSCQIVMKLVTVGDEIVEEPRLVQDASTQNHLATTMNQSSLSLDR